MEKPKFSIDKLLEKPFYIIATAYPIFLIAVIGIGFIYLFNNEQMSRNSLNPVAPDTSVVVSKLTIQEPRIASAIDLSQISSPNNEMIEKGKNLYTTVCSSCHGVEGKGDGVAGVAFNPKPRNFHEETGWKNGRKFFEMYNTLEKGITVTGMPAYDYMAVEERTAIIQFIRKNFMSNAPSDSPQEIAELDKAYSLSAGMKVAGTIPVNNASVLIQKEALPKSQKIINTIAKINELKTSNATAQLFFDISIDSEKAILTILNSNNSMRSEKDFSQVITNEVIVNGFSSEVINLSSQQLRELFNLLKQVIA
ncbi:MAG: cytochrome c [Ignavibacteria bacterium]|nr:cytochrome c [Ignavibacteria bacterium]